MMKRKKLNLGHHFIAGFSFIEVLVAVSILALLTLAGTDMQITAIRSFRTNETRAQLTQELGRIADRLDRELRRASEATLRANDRAVAVGEDDYDNISFRRTIYDEDNNVIVIDDDVYTYSWNRNENELGLTMPDGAGGEQTVLIARDLTGFSVAYTLGTLTVTIEVTKTFPYATLDGVVPIERPTVTSSRTFEVFLRND